MARVDQIIHNLLGHRVLQIRMRLEALAHTIEDEWQPILQTLIETEIELAEPIATTVASKATSTERIHTINNTSKSERTSTIFASTATRNSPWPTTSRKLESEC